MRVEAYEVDIIRDNKAILVDKKSSSFIVETKSEQGFKIHLYPDMVGGVVNSLLCIRNCF